MLLSGRHDLSGCQETFWSMGPPNIKQEARRARSKIVCIFSKQEKEYRAYEILNGTEEPIQSEKSLHLVNSLDVEWTEEQSFVLLVCLPYVTRSPRLLPCVELQQKRTPLSGKWKHIKFKTLTVRNTRRKNKNVLVGYADVHTASSSEQKLQKITKLQNTEGFSLQLGWSGSWTFP